MVHKLNAYYRDAAENYDTLHVRVDDEHDRALHDSKVFIEAIQVSSVLDVGCGTGRSLKILGDHLPEARLCGIEPSPEMLAKARAAVPRAELQQGAGEHLPYPGESVDLVVATGILHHVDDPQRCIREMFRVARKAVLISDHNNFAFGGSVMRRIRLGLFSVSLLKLATFVKQGFRAQGYSRDDGWWYPYSLLNDFRLVSSLAGRVWIGATRPANSGDLGNFLYCQSHLSIFAVKPEYIELMRWDAEPKAQAS